MTTDAPASYTDKLLNEFTSLKKANFKIDEIVEIINDFREAERLKKQEKVDIVPVGKYKYKKVIDVARFDKQYLEWILKQEWISNYPNFITEVKKHL